MGCKGYALCMANVVNELICRVEYEPARLRVTGPKVGTAAPVPKHWADAPAFSVRELRRERITFLLGGVGLGLAAYYLLLG